MQPHQVLHEPHPLIERQSESGEDALGHGGANGIVSVEGPPGSLDEFLGVRLGDVVQDGGPAEPEIVAHHRHVVEHLQGVPEVVFMPVILHFLHAVEFHHFGEERG